MKSYFLQSVDRPLDVDAALSRLLPGQRSPWLLCSSDGDPAAYFDVDSTDPTTVFADMSGRNYSGDPAVISTLRALQALVGGIIVDQDDEEPPPN